MGYVVDSKQRLRVPQFKPGETWQDTWTDENHLVLTKLVPAPEPAARKVTLRRDEDGILVGYSDQPVSYEDTRKALEDFP